MYLSDTMCNEAKYLSINEMIEATFVERQKYFQLWELPINTHVTSKCKTVIMLNILLMKKNHFKIDLKNT